MAFDRKNLSFVMFFFLIIDLVLDSRQTFLVVVVIENGITGTIG